MMRRVSVSMLLSESNKRKKEEWTGYRKKYW